MPRFKRTRDWADTRRMRRSGTALLAAVMTGVAVAAATRLRHALVPSDGASAPTPRARSISTGWCVPVEPADARTIAATPTRVAVYAVTSASIQ